MKKIFCPKSSYTGGKKPLIDFDLYFPEQQKSDRHRLDFGLPDIEDAETRDAVGKALAATLPKIVSKLVTLIESPGTNELTGEPELSVKKAFLNAVLIKHTAAQSENTKADYDVIKKEFLKWLDSTGTAHWPVSKFKRQQAREYWATLCARKTRKGTPLSGCTLNNKLVYLRAVFTCMVGEKYMDENPFQTIVPAIEEPKERRNFSDEEAKIVSAYIQEKNIWLYRALLLQYYCYIRPVELTRLKFRDFDLTQGTVSVQVMKGTVRRRIATIPDSVLPHFRNQEFASYPTNYWVFGIVKEEKKQYRTYPSMQKIGENRLYRQHEKVLKKLHEIGTLKDITGLTWYSWKDTGISVHTHHVLPINARDQAGHSSFDITLKYYHAPEINTAYKNLPDTLK